MRGWIRCGIFRTFEHAFQAEALRINHIIKFFNTSDHENAMVELVLEYDNVPDIYINDILLNRMC